jgi:GntR family transcriptional regulator/MocR family aminotransferase
MRKIYRDRRDALTQAIGQHCQGHLTVIPSAAGLHIAARLSPRHRAGAIVARAVGEGIGLQALERYASAKSPPNGLAFGYGLIETRRIAEAVVQLAGLLA